MAHEELAVRRHEQDGERRRRPAWPDGVADRGAKPEHFGDADAIVRGERGRGRGGGGRRGRSDRGYGCARRERGDAEREERDATWHGANVGGGTCGVNLQ